MTTSIKKLFRLDDDAASDKEVIEIIERGVDFRGAKLWILMIAVFLASLGLNTNSAAVIIGAMLISPIMGPIIGMGLGVGIFDFDLLRRSWRNFIIATIFSILTATIYFLITPITVVQSELLARTSPTIYDVLIALCGGLAGIIAISSRSQRSGNVIPGVAIATALMPPLCTVGFGIATANWTYALGAFYLFVINSIFIALSTFLGAVFIMKFEKKVYVDRHRERRVKHAILTISVITILPAILLTIGMVRQNYFQQHVGRFIQQELNYPMTQVIKHRIDYKTRSFDVVLIGNEVDSATLQIARNRLPDYQLEDVEMRVIQGVQSSEFESFREMLLADSRELDHAESVIAQQQMYASELEQQLASFTALSELSPMLLRELKALYPQVESVTTAIGTTAMTDSLGRSSVVLIKLSAKIDEKEQSRLTSWLNERSGSESVKVVFEN